MSTQNLPQNSPIRNGELTITLNQDLERFTPEFLEGQIREIDLAERGDDVAAKSWELGTVWDTLVVVYDAVCNAYGVEPKDDDFLMPGLAKEDAGQQLPTQDSPLDPDLIPTYPDPERAALIEQCAGKVEEVIFSLARFRESLLKARNLAPAEVDPGSLYDLHMQAQETMDTLSREFEIETEFEELFETITGKAMWPIYLEREINAGNWNDPGGKLFREELTRYGQENSQEANRLLALFDARQAQMGVK